MSVIVGSKVVIESEVPFESGQLIILVAIIFGKNFPGSFLSSAGAVEPDKKGLLMMAGDKGGSVARFR
jgi:hypothetical protein